MELLSGKFLMNQKEEAITTAEVLRQVQYVILYCSASWSPPCQTFLPKLKEIYREAKTQGISIEVIFVPSDHDTDEMSRHFAANHDPWYAVPVGALGKALRKKFHVVSIPQLIVLSIDGKIISKNGRRELEKLEEPLKTWFPEHFVGKLFEQHTQSYMTPEKKDDDDEII